MKPIPFFVSSAHNQTEFKFSVILKKYSFISQTFPAITDISNVQNLRDVYSKSMVLVCFNHFFVLCSQGGEVVQETITSNLDDDSIILEFQRTDGTLITQLIDFRNVRLLWIKTMDVRGGKKLIEESKLMAVNVILFEQCKVFRVFYWTFHLRKEKFAENFGQDSFCI